MDHPRRILIITITIITTIRKIVQVGKNVRRKEKNKKSFGYK